MAIEIVDFPIKNGGSFHSFLYVYQAGYSCFTIRKESHGVDGTQFRYHGNPVLKTPKTKEVGNLYTVTYNIEEPMNSRLVFVISTHVCWLYQHFSCELHQLSLRHLRLGSSGWISMNFPFKTLNKDALFFWTWRKIMSSTIGFWSAIFLDIWAGLFSRLDG